MNRPMQWFAIGLGHAIIAGLILQTSPQAGSPVREVIQARLITSTSQPLQAVTPNVRYLMPQKEQLRSEVARRQPMSPTILTTARRVNAAPSALAKPVSGLSLNTSSTSTPVVTTPPATFVPPIFNAAYLDNPPPPYPPASRRLSETGHVLLRVFVSATGRAERVELKVSSGFDRLDDAARAAVIRWRFVPARRGDEPVAAWVVVPITFAM